MGPEQKKSAEAASMNLSPEAVPSGVTDDGKELERHGSLQAGIVVDPAMEKRVLRKLDRRLAPLFALLYFLAYLDRSNIGNAAVVGLKSQLHLTEEQYSTAVSVFFATYVVFELPVVLAMRRLRPHVLIASMALAWAVVTIGTAFVRSFGSLVACRVLLGLCEAGFFPCLSLYITMAYKREEQGLRLAYLFTSSSLSSMFGGLIATGITKVGEVGNLQAWSWLYIIEGLVSTVIAPFIFLYLPDNPSQAKFWTPEEHAVMEQRDVQRQEYLGSQVFEWNDVASAFCDPKLYATALIQFFQDIILYGFSTFLPSILKLGLGYSSLQAQYLGVPVYALGGISFFSAAVLGDKLRLRGTLLFFMDIFAVVGYILLLSVKSAGVQYFACYLIAIPLYCGPGLNEIWVNNNMAGHYRRATAIGVQQAIGNLAGVVAPQVYRKAPYRLGHWASLVSGIISMCLIAAQITYLWFMNRRKEQILNGQRADDRRVTTGESALEFRYIY